MTRLVIPLLFLFAIPIALATKAKDDFERCYVEIGSRDTGAFDGRLFNKLLVGKSGQVREIIFFKGASPKLKVCLARILNGFGFS
jgi:hypothetical protein